MDYKKKYEETERLYRTANADQRYVLESLFPKLRESEDERIRKEIIEHCRNTRCVTEERAERIAKWIAWLEKQGKQKPTIEMKSAEESLGIDSETYNKIVDECIYGDDKQKPVNKVEPKFKIGDWVVSPNGVYWHIDAIQNGRYEVTADTGQCGNWPLDTNIYRLWTIQDAKNGDVLSDGTTIFIFKDLLSDGSVMSYCDYDTDSGESDAFCPLSVNLICSKITPATKEQRDILFQKMEEAGYSWDDEKKELKKIEQKPATMSIDEAIEHCKEKSCGNNACALEHKQLEKWLTELKELKEQKPAWSEKDECYMSECIGAIATKDGWSFEEKRKTKHWLESLKQTIGWKPSDEQITVLELASKYERVFTPKQIDILIDLKEQLKKLRGE